MSITSSAVVTGAASGIGQSIALELARVGYGLILWDINEAGLKETAQMARQLTTQCVHDQIVDVSDAARVHEAARVAREEGFAVRAVVANAGIVRLDSLLNPDPEAAKRTMAVNVDGVYNTLQAWAQNLVEGGSESAAVVIGSTEGIRGAPELNSYCRSKAAVLGIMRAAATELGPHGVRVNSILPGPIRTPMYEPEKLGPEAMALDAVLQAKTPLRRVGLPEEVAKVARFLLSSDASYMAGAELVVDGGLTAAL
ncbi:3-oxoacyl-reductase FabG [Aspergillus sergii]|uniref:3-oxoacyl-reductase FabG n=1 Tax=Aspergillus sergii TaxID=1034303 RepID=A0A5N6XEP3_9EURO|nr:3-oxoacyl-reductase FabG [Aspergillus sergii]